MKLLGIFSKDISAKAFFIICPLLFCIKLWLVQAHTVMVTVTPHDDLLFIRHAQSLLSGDWLGEYNQLTLIKEPFYPIFIALSNWLCIPLLVAQQILYAFSCVVFIWAIRPVVRNRYVLLVVYIILLLNPGSYNYPAIGRIFQLAIYAPLAMMVLSFLLGMAIRSRQSLGKGLFWSFGLGVSFSLFWITRDESIFIVPSLLLVSLFLLLTIGRKSRKHFFQTLLLVVLPFVLMTGTIRVIEKINMAKYGVPAVVEITSDAFKAAYGGLLRIKSNQERQFFPAVRDARMKAYAVSPTFKEVEEYLEGPVGLGWQTLAGNNDIPAAFFIWAFRDSVAAAGYYKSGPEALRFYQKMGDEIDAACDSGKLNCRQRPNSLLSSSSLVPPWRPEYNKLVLPTFYAIILKTIAFDGFNASTESARSFGPAEIMDLFSAVTGEDLLSSKRNHNISWELESHLNKEKTRILGQIGWVYQLLSPYLFFLSLVILLWNIFTGLKKRRLNLMTVFSMATLGAIFSITFVMTLVTITSYSEVARIMQVSFPLVLLFILSVFLDVISQNEISPVSLREEAAL
jgi:hypothetical protein